MVKMFEVPDSRLIKQFFTQITPYNPAHTFQVAMQFTLSFGDLGWEKSLTCQFLEAY